MSWKKKVGNSVCRKSVKIKKAIFGETAYTTNYFFKEQCAYIFAIQATLQADLIQVQHYSNHSQPGEMERIVAAITTAF